MPLLDSVGPKYFEIGKKWVTSAGMWSVAGALGVFYITEFRTLLQWVPGYGAKYRNWPPLKAE